tara:strand:+ start:187 stop:645 length:459 start_codon:yes stop_codon:yes gene_type:complete
VSFFNRFSFFLIGSLLGCILLFFSLQFRDRSLSFNYFPDSRIKNHLIKHKVSFSDKAVCKMNCYNLDTLLLPTYITNSVVDFKKSKIRGFSPKLYYLSIDLPFKQDNFNETSYMIFEINHDMVTLIDVFFNLAVPLNQVSSHPSTYHCPDCF